MKKVRQGKIDSGSDLDVRASIDAVKLTAVAFLKNDFLENDSYERSYDYRLAGGPDKLYSRACGFVNTATGSKIGVAYDPLKSFMPACVVTISPNDKVGLQRPELEQLVDMLPDYRFGKIEVAFDFCVGSVVNDRFARKHLLVGKSQRREDPEYPNILHYGARLSPVLGRCYAKKSVNGYRIEIEFHSEWLKEHGIRTTNDFLKLPELTARRHIAFFKIDALKVSAALARLGVPVASTLRKVIAREDDLHFALRYLRHRVGLANAQRVLTPLATNTRVERALQVWVRVWKKQGRTLAGVA